MTRTELRLPRIPAIEGVVRPDLPERFDDLHILQFRLNCPAGKDAKWSARVRVAAYDWDTKTILPSSERPVTLPDVIAKAEQFPVLQQTLALTTLVIGWTVREKELTDKIDGAPEGMDTTDWETQLATVQGKLSLSLADVLVMLSE